MICHFSKEDQFGQSTNSWVDLDDFVLGGLQQLRLLTS